MAITYHYTNLDFKIVTGLLDFIPLSGRHTGNNIAEAIINVFKEFQIKKEQIFTMTVDNASNIDVLLSTLIREGYLKNAENHIRCFAHVLNLAAQDPLKMIEKIIFQIRSHIEFIRKSSVSLEDFELICKVNKEN